VQWILVDFFQKFIHGMLLSPFFSFSDQD